MRYAVIPILLLAIALASCDCWQHVTGKVFDKGTGQPLDSAYASKGPDQKGTYSNPQGDFKLEGVSGGICGCPPMTVTISKKGYADTTVKIKNNSRGIIYLNKKK